MGFWNGILWDGGFWDGIAGHVCWILTAFSILQSHPQPHGNSICKSMLHMYLAEKFFLKRSAMYFTGFATAICALVGLNQELSARSMLGLLATGIAIFIPSGYYISGMVSFECDSHDGDFEPNADEISDWIYKTMHKYFADSFSAAAEHGYIDGKWVDDTNIFLFPWHVEIAARISTHHMYYRKLARPKDYEAVHMIFQVLQLTWIATIRDSQHLDKERNRRIPFRRNNKSGIFSL
jgi:hypothetical protein